ncbi:MAG: helix-turn-helix domain-containing protein [Caldilineaceae bacterium]
MTAARFQSNLAEAHAELGEVAPAQAAWQAGLTLARRRFGRRGRLSAQLLEQFPALQGTAFTETGADSSVPTQANDATAAPQDFEAQQALQLARARGGVSTRDLMEATGVSKATATRKLAALAEDGSLLKVGQGRNTHYVPPAQTDDAAPTTTSADPRQVLRQQRVLLEHYYGITGLALLTPPAQVAWLELAAAFAELPDLLAIFALEARLARTLARPVRLRPLAALHDAPDETPLAQAEWLWRAAEN